MTNDNKQWVKFSEVILGSVFRHEGNAYLSIGDNAMDEDGDFRSFDPNEDVALVCDSSMNPFW